MAFEAIQLYIAGDIASSITTSACSVYLSNTDLWSSPALVPSYAYKSFGELWVGVTATSSQVANRIVFKIGENLEASEGDLTFLGDEIQSTDVSNDGMYSNDPGSETMFLDMVLKLPEELQNWDQIMNAELRIRYLLDENWRKKRKAPPYVPNLGDPLVDGNLRVRWIRYLVPPNAKEVWSRYMVAFSRAVPR